MVMTHYGYDTHMVGHIISEFDQKGAFNFITTEHHHQ